MLFIMPTTNQNQEKGTNPTFKHYLKRFQICVQNGCFLKMMHIAQINRETVPTKMPEFKNKTGIATLTNKYH
jgi:hypothetical protein